MSRATTSAPPMTRIHSRTARPTLRWLVVSSAGDPSSSRSRSPRSLTPRGRRGRSPGRRRPAPVRSPRHRTLGPVPIGGQDGGRRGRREEQRVLRRAPAHRAHVQSMAGQGLGHRRHGDGLLIGGDRAPRRPRSPRRGRPRPGAPPASARSSCGGSGRRGGRGRRPRSSGRPRSARRRGRPRRRWREPAPAPSCPATSRCRRRPGPCRPRRCRPPRSGSPRRARTGT